MAERLPRHSPALNSPFQSNIWFQAITIGKGFCVTAGMKEREPGGVPIPTVGVQGQGGREVGDPRDPRPPLC